MANMRPIQPQIIPISLVDGNIFGRYAEISVAESFNMIVSDGWAVSYAGYDQQITIDTSGIGRSIYSSARANILLAVVDDGVFSINANNNFVRVGLLQSFSGNVSIAENNVNQIALCDGQKIYIYNTVTGSFTMPTLPDGLLPGYVSFQDGRFIATNRVDSKWYLSAVGDGNNWFPSSGNQPSFGAIETKPDLAQAAIPFPGKGNLLLVLGKTVGELWTDVGAQLFPYKKNTSININYGCLNPATIAFTDKIVCWLGSNENSGPVIMYSTGGDVTPISTDGINSRLERLSNPQQSTAFFFKQDGHLFYQITFYSSEDNITLTYDFNTKKFYSLTDEKMNHHIARKIAFFNNKYFFVSFKDGDIYRLSTDISTYDCGIDINGERATCEIPRVITCQSIDFPLGQRNTIDMVYLLMQQGEDPLNQSNSDPNYNPRIALSISKDSGSYFGSYVNRPLQPIGRRQTRVRWWPRVSTNNVTFKFRFYGRGNFIAKEAFMEVH